VCGVINPGSSTESLNEIMKKEVGNLTINDFLVISSGSNDISSSDPSVAFRNIVNYIENVKHTNVILVCAPFRYDTTNHSCLNNSIQLFNSKVSKLAKMFGQVRIKEMTNDRLLYTRQGSHLNGLGKEILSNQLVSHIFSWLERANVKPITLGWHNKEIQIDLSNTKSLPAQLPTRQTSKCNRKTPISRNGDFFMGYLNGHSSNHSVPSFKDKDFVIYHQNIRGLNTSKLDELFISPVFESSHIVCLTEHQLRDTAMDAILMTGFRLGASFCRNTFKNGGVCIFV
jgi:hypothetical protein